MKPHFKPIATALAATLQIAAIAAVPVAWTNSPGLPPYQLKPVPHGVPVDFRVTLRGYTEPPIAPGADLRLWYQTNGMGTAWWSAPATFDGNTITASFGPAQDCGADRVSLFFGAPSNVFASAVLRLTHSPGFAPGAMPDPESFREADPVFAAWLATYTPPDTSLAPATNYTDAATNALDIAKADRSVVDSLIYAVGNKASYDDLSNYAPTNHGHAALTDGTNTITAARDVYEVAKTDTVWKYVITPPGYTTVTWLTAEEAQAWTNEGEGWYVDCYYGPGGRISDDPDADRLEWSIFTMPMESSPDEEPFEVHAVATRRVAGKTYAVGRLALTNDLPDTAEIERDLADLRTETALVYRLYSGSNVVAEVTNYNSAVHAPELRLMQLNESNEYVTVWTETNGLSRTLASARQYTDVATGDVVKAVAPRAWSKVTAGMGVEAPSNTTWISTPTTVFAGGLEYAKVVDTYGEVWVLSGNGMMEFDHDTNSYFRISADDGTPVFSIEKTDAMTVGADADGIEVGASTVTIPVGVVAAEHPTMYWRHALDSGEWADENSPPTGATVAWSGTSGTWVCTVTWSGTRPSSMFFRFTFLQEGGVVIRNNATTDLSSGIVINGTNFVPRVTGGTLTWEVVQ